MSAIGIYIDVITNKYAKFTGRARRREFWYFFLIHLITTVCLSAVAIFNFETGSYSTGYTLWVINNLYLLFILIPFLAISVRRLQDSGNSGWLLLLGFIPILGFLILIVFLVLDSQSGTNRYGPNPKEGDTAISDYLV